MLIYNLLHNLGSMYDLGEEFYYRVIVIDALEKIPLTMLFWARMGFIFGSIFHNLFEYPVNFDTVVDPE